MNMDTTSTKAAVKCDICQTNRATTKVYWTFRACNQQFLFLSCGPCTTLNSRSVLTLIGLSKEKRWSRIKKWWDSDKRETTLLVAYPGVAWMKVRVG